MAKKGIRVHADVERVDANGFDLRRFLPDRLASMLGMPGHASLRRARRLADELTGEIADAVAGALCITPHEGQLVASAALVQGMAVEMDTGEGKTLTGAMAAAWLARRGRRVHVLSVNDYLAERDAEWMGPLFARLGVTVAWIGQASTADERRSAYAAQVVYAPVSEVGYDLLRDRQVLETGERVSPVFDVAIVDEADAVMIDEAMTPLVLAGTGPDEADDLSAATALVRELDPRAHYTVDDDHATVTLTDAGLDTLESRLGGVNLFDLEHSDALTRINLALHAHALVQRDVDYLVTGDGIHLINAARGRIAQRQRWPDGLHAAIEVKEGLGISAPGVVLDAITVQDLLRGYTTLAGMSGTILPVAEELMEFFSLPSARVDRHRPSIRREEPLRVFRTEAEKTDAAVVSTTPYPSSRLDAQLRGRAGRQGDPGVTVSFASIEDDLVQAHATGYALRQLGGRSDERPARRAVREAQRIAESVRLGQHRATWQYHRAIAAQRGKVLQIREGVLTASAPEPRERARRLLTLHYLDERWREHLAHLTEVRDGVYLRVLAGQNPVDEFHRIALEAFAGFFEGVEADAADALAGLTADQLDDPLGRLGLRRPSATWTYMMRDNPLGDAGSRAARGLRRMLRHDRS